MSTYICKCGKTFEKNINAGTTGNRMPDYGPEHECWGCPYVCEIATWDPLTQQQATTNYECRASKNIRYDTTAELSLGDKCVGRIYSLDLDFLRCVREFADTLEGIEPDRYALDNRPTDYCDDGRKKLSIYPSPNAKGVEAKRLIYKEFFTVDGRRMYLSPSEEKELILDQIEKAKEKAQGNEDDLSLPDPDANPELDKECPVEPCSWKNASGESEEPEEEEAEESENEITGERVSLRDHAFDSLLDACDGKINQALRFAVDAKQSFTFTAKITFEPRGGAFCVKHETGYQFDPIKVKSKGELFEAIPIELDPSGCPIIPYDRERQLTIEDTMEQDASATVTVDSSGVVEAVALDSELDDEEANLPDFDPSPLPDDDLDDDHDISGLLEDDEDDSDEQQAG